MWPKSVIRTIKESANLAQQLIRELYDKDPRHETFDQAGILTGQETVEDYLSHGEWGLALQHCLYMIHESDIPFPQDQIEKLHLIATTYNIRNHYSQENQDNRFL